MKKTLNFLQKYAGTFAILFVIFFGYKFVTDAEILGRYLFPQVGDIGQSFVEKWPEMLLNLKASMLLLIPGLVIGVLVALAIGIPMGLRVKLRRALYPIIYGTSMIPVVLLSPFAVHIAPTLRAAGLFLVVWGTIWSMLFATINGIMTIDKRYLDNATALELKGVKRLVKVILPAALPSMAGGFVTSVRQAFISLVFAEMYGTRAGLGYFVRAYSELSFFQHVWSGFLLIAAVMIIFMQIIERSKDKLLKWTIN